MIDERKYFLTDSTSMSCPPYDGMFVVIMEIPEVIEALLLSLKTPINEKFSIELVISPLPVMYLVSI